MPVAAVLGGLAGLAGSWAEMLAFVVLAIAAGLLTVIDLAEERLPDAIVLPLIPITLVLFTIAAAVTGDWWSLLRAVEAGAALFVFVFAMMIFSPDLGFGDVKLAAITGAFCGWFSWGAVLLGFAAAWITFAALGVVLLATRKRHGRSSFAFGPFLILGAVLGVFWAGCRPALVRPQSPRSPDRASASAAAPGRRSPDGPRTRRTSRARPPGR